MTHATYNVDFDGFLCDANWKRIPRVPPPAPNTEPQPPAVNRLIEQRRATLPLCAESCGRRVSISTCRVCSVCSQERRKVKDREPARLRRQRDRRRKAADRPLCTICGVQQVARSHFIRCTDCSAEHQYHPSVEVRLFGAKAY